jgi:sec-independent protein translocase protein TatB
MSFGEMVILGVIALVVVGPRRLPSMLRTAGQLIGRIRRMAMDIRADSGIDEILDAEGIRTEIDNFRRLAQGEIAPDEPERPIIPEREREYPRVGADAYGALAEDVVPYSPSPAIEAVAAGSESPASRTAEPSSVTPASTSPSPVAVPSSGTPEANTSPSPVAVPSSGTPEASTPSPAAIPNSGTPEASTPSPVSIPNSGTPEAASAGGETGRAGASAGTEHSANASPAIATQIGDAAANGVHGTVPRAIVSSAPGDASAGASGADAGHANASAEIKN